MGTRGKIQRAEDGTPAKKRKEAGTLGSHAARSDLKSSCKSHFAAHIIPAKDASHAQKAPNRRECLYPSLGDYPVYTDKDLK